MGCEANETAITSQIIFSEVRRKMRIHKQAFQSFLDGTLLAV
jgi:hypothetical protein